MWPEIGAPWPWLGLTETRSMAIKPLGVRNSWSVETSREFKVSRVCLPPGYRSDHWQEILAATPSGSFWSYLYRCAVLAVCPGEAAAPDPAGKPALDRRRRQGPPFASKLPSISTTWRSCSNSSPSCPLVVALPHSPRPRGQLPPWLVPRPLARPPPVNKLQAKGLFDIFMTKIRGITSEQGAW